MIKLVLLAHFHKKKNLGQSRLKMTKTRINGKEKIISHFENLLLIWVRAASPKITETLLKGKDRSSFSLPTPQLFFKRGLAWNYNSKCPEDERALFNFRQRSPILVVDWKQRKVKCLFTEQEKLGTWPKHSSLLSFVLPYKRWFVPAQQYIFTEVSELWQDSPRLCISHVQHFPPSVVPSGDADLWEPKVWRGCDFTWSGGHQVWRRWIGKVMYSVQLQCPAG